MPEKNYRIAVSASKWRATHLTRIQNATQSEMNERLISPRISRHRGFCIAPIVKMELKSKLKDKYGGDDNTCAEYNHLNMD